MGESSWRCSVHLPGRLNAHLLRRYGGKIGGYISGLDRGYIGARWDLDRARKELDRGPR